MKKLILTSALVLSSVSVGFAASSLFQETKDKLVQEYAYTIEQELTKQDVDNSSDMDVFLTDEKERIRVETLEYLKQQLAILSKEKGEKQAQAKGEISKEADKTIEEIKNEIDRLVKLNQE